MNNRKAVRILIFVLLLNMTTPALLVYTISAGYGPQKVEHIILYIAPYTVINAITLLYTMKNRPKKRKKPSKKEY